MRALSNPPFGEYRVWWSLSDSKYAGTALLVKKKLRPKKISFSLDRAGRYTKSILGDFTLRVLCFPEVLMYGFDLLFCSQF